MTKNNNEEIEIRELLKSAAPRINPELPRDLWPVMLNRMQAPESKSCWYDWALLAGLCCLALLYPHGILQLLYQL